MGSNEEVRDHGHLFQHNKCPAAAAVMDTALIPDTVSESMFKSSANCLDAFWDPAILGIQRVGDSSCMVVENEYVNSQYHSNHQATGISYNMGEMMQSFGSGNFSAGVIGSYNMEVDESVSHSSFPLNQGPHLHPHHNSPFGKRKRKNVEVGRQQKDLPSQGISDCPREQPEKQIKDANLTGAGTVAESSKENYIHVRAKRGQATNSHSLAERVRREKISERMKMLQELVPGCNKITGKAVMLDEIINYVQSLQQQVEFLSMKLATVNPELNVDIENMLSKDILQSRPGNTGRISLGSSSSHPFPGPPLGTIQSFPGTVLPFHSLPQNLWNNELHSVLQMGYDSNPSSVSSLGTNGLSKMEK